MSQQLVQPDLFFPVVVIPRTDGTFLVKAGKPVVREEEIDVAEACKILRCSKHTIYRYIEDRDLTGKQAKKRGRIRLLRTEVEALEQRNRNGDS